jgi:hypothetical protein
VGGFCQPLVLGRISTPHLIVTHQQVAIQRRDADRDDLWCSFRHRSSRSLNLCRWLTWHVGASFPDKRHNRGHVTRATPPRTVILSWCRVPICRSMGKIAVCGAKVQPGCMFPPQTAIFARKHQYHLANEVICPANDPDELPQQRGELSPQDPPCKECRSTSTRVHKTHQGVTRHPL